VSGPGRGRRHIPRRSIEVPPIRDNTFLHYASDRRIGICHARQLNCAGTGCGEGVTLAHIAEDSPGSIGHRGPVVSKALLIALLPPECCVQVASGRARSISLCDVQGMCCDELTRLIWFVDGRLAREKAPGRQPLARGSERCDHSAARACYWRY